MLCCAKVRNFTLGGTTETTSACRHCTYLKELRQRLGQHAGVCPRAFNGVGLTSARDPIRHHDTGGQSAFQELRDLRRYRKACGCKRTAVTIGHSSKGVNAMAAPPGWIRTMGPAVAWKYSVCDVVSGNTRV